MRGSHSDPQTPKLPQTQRPSLSRVGVYRLNDSKAEEGLTPQDRKKNPKNRRTETRKPQGVKSMLIFTVVVLKTSSSLNTDASESLLVEKRRERLAKKIIAQRSPLFSPEEDSKTTAFTFLSVQSVFLQPV